MIALLISASARAGLFKLNPKISRLFVPCGLTESFDSSFKIILEMPV